MKLVIFSLLIALINGLNELTYISSTAQFISNVGAEKLPIVTIIVSLLAPVGSLLLDKLYHRWQKYWLLLASYSVFLLAFFLGAYYFVTPAQQTHMAWAYAILSSLNTVLYSMVAWNIFNFYFNVFETRTYFFYFTIAAELGALGVDVLVHRYFYAYDLRAFQFVCFAGTAIICGLVAIVASQRPLKFKLEEDGAEPEKKADSTALNRNFFTLIIFIFLGFHSLCTIIDYQYNVAIEAEFKSADKLNQFIATFQIVSAVVVIAISYLTSRFLVRKTSVVGLLVATGAAISAGILGLNMFPVFYAFCAVEFIRAVLDHSIFYTAFGQLTNTLSSSLSTSFRGNIEGKLAPVLTLIVSGVLLFFPNQRDFKYLNVALMILGLGFLYAAWQLRKYYVSYHRKNLESTDREQIVRSTQALGEYRNLLAIDPLLTLLEKKSEDKSLSKEIIVSLGKIRVDRLLKRLYDQTRTDAEIIQSASLESIASIDSFAAQRFLIDFLGGQYCKSLVVRERLMKLLHGLLKTGIVTHLIPFLESKDDRIVANTIEAMADIKDKRIVSIVEPFLGHANNRVRANAVIVLYKFKPLRRQCQDALRAFRTHEQMASNCSYLYAAGRLKLHKDIPDMLTFADRSEIRYRVNLAYALANMGDKRGLALFGLFRSKPEDIKQSLHHFLQLNEKVRMRILGLFANGSPSNEQIEVLSRSFKESPFDFDEHVELLKGIRPSE